MWNDISIESEILQSLERSGLLKGRSILRILTGRSFVAVELDDGSIGTAMDYARYPQRGNIQILEDIGTEPYNGNRLRPVSTFLERDLDTVDLTEQAIKIALLSALSQPLLTEEALSIRGWASSVVSYQEQRAPYEANWARATLETAVGEANVVGIVGFGGFLEMIANLPSVTTVLVCDRDFRHRANAIEATIARLNLLFAGKIKFVGDNIRLLADRCDVVQLTASALCNGTMDSLLNLFIGRPLMLVGPSGSLVPEPWFKLGFRLICTERRDQGYITSYKYDDHLYDWFVEYDNRLYILSKKDLTS